MEKVLSTGDALQKSGYIVITHHAADTNNDHLQTSMACLYGMGAELGDESLPAEYLGGGR